MIAIINYGLGNIKAFATIYHKLKIPFVIAEKKQELNKATKIILPGVGSFDHAMEQLNKSGMMTCLSNLVLQQNIPLLGVCVGMQMLANESEEGSLPGLSWIDATVKKFVRSHASVKQQSAMLLPHMGWNNVFATEKSSLFCQLEQDSCFYFLHSYYFECNNPENIIGKTQYYGQFASAINHKNIYGVQFHPEKSHHFGVQLLKNFANL